MTRLFVNKALKPKSEVLKFAVKMKMKVYIVLFLASAIANCHGFGLSQVKRKLQHEFEPLVDNTLSSLRRQFAPKSKNPVLLSRLRGFSWKTCNTTSNPVVEVDSVSISPDPLYFPGALTVSTKFKIRKDVDSPIKADVIMKKAIGGGEYIQIPCLGNFGSCTYDDICQLLAQIQGNCPPQLVQIGIDCSCPLRKKAYKLKQASFDIGASVIPTGDYEIQAALNASGAEVVCLAVTLSVG